MSFNKNSVEYENYLKNVLGYDFKFIRNKQTFYNENEIKLLKKLIEKHI